MSAPAGTAPTSDAVRYRLRLFVAGDEVNSVQARRNLRRVCDEVIPGQYTIEEIDVLSNPGAALKERILVTPSLIVTTNQSDSRLLVFGNLSDTTRLKDILNGKR